MMPTFRIPAPLRPYAGEQSAVRVGGGTVGAALDDLTLQYPELRPHLFERDQLRSFVNVFLDKEDVRHRDGLETAVGAEDTLLIIPSIAGGSAAAERRVDQSALRSNQAFIIALLLLAFVLDSAPLAAAVAVVMLLGTAAPPLALFQQIYRRVLRPAGLVRPDVVADNPEPHRFAQGFGGTVLIIGAAALLTGAPAAGWSLIWLVVALAALNLFAGFCAGCFVYYQLNRRNVPGFGHSPVRR